MPDLVHNMLPVLGAALAALIAWLAAHLIGKPILAIRDARLEAIRVAERYAFVSNSASFETVSAADKSLLDVSSRLRSLSRGHGWPARLYCRWVGYDLEDAAGAISGLQHMAGENVPKQIRKNNLNFVYYSLNAYSHIPDEELTILKVALEECEASKKAKKVAALFQP